MLKIASPCPANWDEMTGDERTRFCGQCDRSVYNLSSMTQTQIDQFILERTGMERTCIRLYRRADGTVMTSDCGVAIKKRRKRFAFLGAGIAALFTIVGGVAIGSRAPITSPSATAQTLLQSPALSWLPALFPALFPGYGWEMGGMMAPHPPAPQPAATAPPAASSPGSSPSSP